MPADFYRMDKNQLACYFTPKTLIVKISLLEAIRRTALAVPY